MTDLKSQFDTIRDNIASDQRDGAMDTDTAIMTSAIVDVFEELLSKLERIAVATETIAQTVNYTFGEPAIRTRADQ